MLRNLLWILCTLTILDSYSTSGLCQSVGGYSKEIIVSIPWGTKPGEVGKLPNILEKTTGGPSSFDVDLKNTIYLLDAGNKRVLIYNDQGELINYFPLDDEYDKYHYGESRIKYVEEEKCIYIHIETKQIFDVYTTNGVLTKRIRYNVGFGGPFTVKNGTIIAAGGYIKSKEGIQEVLKDDEMSYRYLQGGKYTGILYRHDEYKYTRGVDSYTLHKPDNTTSVMQIKGGPLDRGTSFLFETTAGEPVFMVFPNNLTNQPIIFLKYDTKFQLKSKIEEVGLFSMKGYYVIQRIGYSEKGEIYSLKLNNTGAYITKYIF